MCRNIRRGERHALFLAIVSGFLHVSARRAGGVLLGAGSKMAQSRPIAPDGRLAAYCVAGLPARSVQEGLVVNLPLLLLSLAMLFLTLRHRPEASGTQT